MNRCFNISARTVFALSTLTILLASQLAQAQTARVRRGTDILHYSTRTVMGIPAALPSPTGVVNVRRYEQGKSSKQILDIVVTGLDSEASYVVYANLTDDPEESRPFAQFTTDTLGQSALRFRSASNGQALGAGKLPLPEFLAPVNEIKAIKIVTRDGAQVLSADLTNPTQFGYLVKRDVSTESVRAYLWTKANSYVGRTWLLAYVAPDSEYRLVLNGEVVQTLTSDSAGRLRIYQTWDTPSEVLKLETLAVVDSTDATVFTTTLP